MATAQKPPPGMGAKPRSSGNIYFGVVGAGKSKRILGLGSSLSSSMTYCEKEDETGYWTCSYCFYDNPDMENTKCSMCGNKRTKQVAPAVPAVPAVPAPAAATEGGHKPNSSLLPTWAEDQSASKMELPELDSDLPNPSERSLSKEKSLQFDMLQKDMEELAAKPPPESMTKEEFMTEVSNHSIRESGGWSCEVCTFVNKNEEHLSCAVCGAERKKEKMEAGAFMGHQSIDEFFTASMANSVESFGQPSEELERQMETYRQFEETVQERERMTRLIAYQKTILDQVGRDSSPSDAAERPYMETPEGLREYLGQLQAKLQAMETTNLDEQEDIANMEDVLNQRRAEIESEEGVDNIEELTGHAVRPGVQKVSPQAIEWTAQRRMLDDWKNQVEVRIQEIASIRSHQESIMQQLQGMN